MELGLLILRVVVGALFVGHGAQKLFGWFGGHGVAGTGQFFESLGMKPGRMQATAAGVAELGGGLLLLLGLLTPIGALMVISVMTVAIMTVHAKNGPWATDNGYEYNAVLIAACVALAGVGAGEWSLDAALEIDMAGTGWALFALGAGILGAIGAVLIGRAGSRAPASTAGPARAGGGRFARGETGGATADEREEETAARG